MRSGDGRLWDVQSRDGLPIAVVEITPTHMYWFDDETPLLRYQISAFTRSNPLNTSYTWSFSGGRTRSGAETSWLFPAAADHTVTLTATSGEAGTKAVHPFFAYSTVRTDLDRAVTRRAFLDTCLTMLRAAPPDTEPTRLWTDSHWNNLFRTLSLGEGDALLAELFVRSRKAMRKTLTPQRLIILEDRFILAAAALDPEATVRWIERFEASAAGKRKAALQVRRGEVLMYYTDDMDSAREILQFRAAGSDEAGEWAKIRLGDAALLAGDLNQATDLYSGVQNRFKASKLLRGSGTRTLAGKLERPALTSRNSAERIDDWKLQAILEASASGTARTFLDQGAYDETYELLRLWERQFPMSKISGDLAILTAKLYIAIGHHQRARRLLAAYCDQVDVSSYLADALSDLLACMIELKEPQETIESFCEDARKRLEFHPGVVQFEEKLRTIRGANPDNETLAPTGDIP